MDESLLAFLFSNISKNYLGENDLTMWPGNGASYEAERWKVLTLFCK
jgi:hypothetical protein